MNTLSFTYPHRKKSQRVKYGLWVPIRQVAYCSPRLIQSIGEGDVHRDQHRLESDSNLTADGDCRPLVVIRYLVLYRISFIGLPL
ncbi:hypothetical protein TNCV_79541 [Trichonephila clavipes]|nr:hypothetical protein TNCV_79541 [Trichonephila clavipes]